MAEDLLPAGENEQLKAENDFLKMKLMLERGAKFEQTDNEELPPEVENEFLKNIMEFEKQYEHCKPIKVFDKLGQPKHFKAANEIPDTEIEKAWKELRSFLGKHGIHLDACSPNINSRELYRFTIEELFEHEMDDMNVPGISICFIYDEFHPDPIYESTKAITEELLPGLFKTDPVNDYFLCLHREDITINGRLYKESKDVKTAFNQFKAFFSHIDLKQTTVDQCNVIDKSKVVINGYYKAVATAVGDNEEITFNGGFNAELQPDELGYWSIKTMNIESITLLK